METIYSGKSDISEIDSIMVDAGKAMFETEAPTVQQCEYAYAHKAGADSRAAYFARSSYYLALAGPGLKECLFVQEDAI